MKEKMLLADYCKLYKDGSIPKGKTEDIGGGYIMYLHPFGVLQYKIEIKNIEFKKEMKDLEKRRKELTGDYEKLYKKIEKFKKDEK